MPQRFGRYVLLDRMGVGGMAEVYRAVAPGAEGFKRDLVVKKILTGQAHAANFIEMFVHEARISALLHHPNVVQVFDFGQVDGTYFLVMELLRGRDLLGVMRALRERQRLLPVPIAAHIAHQVALGLAYAHGLTAPTGEPLNIVHRDVSPSNVMCLRAGGVKLLDFGVARAIGEVESSEAEGSFNFKGKLGYMAPERLLGRSEDHRVDLFALGVVLWEMLTGRRLFQGKTDEEKIRGILKKRVPAPSSIRPEVPPALDAIVARALERDPEQRYQSGAVMADELETVVAELKYHSRMLPALLAELFGSSPSAAHVTMATLPPEFLMVEPTPSASAASAAAALAEASRTPSTTAPATDAAPAATAGRRALLAGGILVTVAALGIGLGAGLRSARTPAPAPVLAAPAVARPAPPPPAEPPPPFAEPAPAVAEPPSPAPSLPSATPSPRRVTAPRVARPAASGRIARGLSIDPFAEAAAREAKK